MTKPSFSNITMFVVVAAASVALTGCLGTSTPAETTTKSTGDTPSAVEKSGTSTKVGTLSQAGDKFFLTEPGQEAKEVNSYSVDLAEYVGQTVTVSGQYSGDTLYIGSIQIGEQ
jgi:hypothetical protein